MAQNLAFRYTETKASEGSVLVSTHLIPMSPLVSPRKNRIKCTGFSISLILVLLWCISNDFNRITPDSHRCGRKSSPISKTIIISVFLCTFHPRIKKHCINNSALWHPRTLGKWPSLFDRWGNKDTEDQIHPIVTPLKLTEHHQESIWLKVVTFVDSQRQYP